MCRSRGCFLLVTIFLTAAAFAAEIRLGPETRMPLLPDIGPAAYDQEQPAAASNGRDFLAVWLDGRGGGNSRALYASRLGIDGRPVDPLGQWLAGVAQTPRVASAGGDYLIAFAADGSNVLHVDENGRPLGDVRRIRAASVPVALASNGATYLLLESPGAIGTILDRDGAPLAKIDTLFGSILWAGAYDGNFIVIDVLFGCDGGCRSEPRLNVISGTGSLLSRVTLPYLPLFGEFIAVAASRDRIVIASYAAKLPTNYLVADYEGHVVRPLGPFPVQVSRAGVQWDGRDFLVMYSDATGGVFGRRMSSNGDLLGDRFLLASDVPSFATSGSKQLLVWSERKFTIYNDVIARVADDFTSLANATQEPVLVSYSPSKQADVRVAGNLAVWHDDANGAIVGKVNGTQITFAPRGSYKASRPAVAVGKKNYLVVWNQWPDGILGRRVAFDGTVLDPTPLVLDYFWTDGRDRPGVAYDGNTFIITTSIGSYLERARLTDDGVVQERTTITFPQMNAMWTTPVVTASRVFTVHTYYRDSVWCLCPIYLSIGIDGNMVIKDAAGERNKARLAVATDRDHVTIAWMKLEGTVWTIQVAQLDADGHVTAGPRQLRDAGGTPTDAIELAWNGSEYVLAWTDTTGRLRAMRLDRSAEAIDSEPFEVAQLVPLEPFSLTPSGSGVMFGYDRIDDATSLTRAFTRALDRLASAPPRRSARH